jgi:predicted dienelactone hydrolase
MLKILCSTGLRLVLSSTVLAGLLACADAAPPPSESPSATPPEIPERPFTAPGGPHATGVLDLFWIDDAREETFTTDPSDRRRVLARIWYPADPTVESTETAPYVPRPEEFESAPEFKQVFHVRTFSFASAPVSSAQERWPVLVYHHGGGWTRFTSTFMTEWLASHGYVVVSVGHAGFNRTELYPDGHPFVMDTLVFPDPTGDLRSDALASWEHLEEHHFPVWAADAASALDRIEGLDSETDGPFSGLLDLERIGMLGWSFGGATAITLSRDDPRVRAAVDLDGQLFGDVPETGTDRPILLFHGGVEPEVPEPEEGEEGTDPEAQAREQAAVMQELIEMVESDYRSLVESSTGDRYRVTVQGASHGHFSDLVLFAPSAPGQLEAARAHEILNALTLQFFDKYLRDRAAPLLDGQDRPFPEVELERRAAG